MKLGFIESIIICFVIGWVNSYLYRKYLRKKNKDWITFLACIFLTIIWMIDILIYFDIINIEFLNGLPWVNLPSSNQGKYYLWNSFLLFGVDFGIIPQSGMGLVSAFLFMTYLPWYYMGSKIGKIIHGYRIYQGGYYMIFRPVKKYIKDREKRLKKIDDNIKP